MAEKGASGARDSRHGLPPGSLLAGEQVLGHWAAPGGLGLLTNLRCLLLSHRHPVHRSVRWAVRLDEIRTVGTEFIAGQDVQGLSVRNLAGQRGPWAVNPSGTQTVQEVGIPPSFQVRVDGAAVFEGPSERCTEIERRIDQARAARSR